MKISRVLLAGVLLLIATLVASGEVLEQWYWRNPLPQGNPLHNVVFVNGQYVALGESGTILTSSDGTNWVAQQSGTTMDLRDCAYGAGKYVVVGDYGTVLTSTNAQTWTARYPGTFYSLSGVTYANEQFVCVGEQTTILTSEDGTWWMPRSSGPWKLEDVVYAGGLIVAAGGNRATANNPGARVLLTSSDGQFWTARVLAHGEPFHSLAYGNGTFAAATRPDFSTVWTVLWSSTNGWDWQPEPPPPIAVPDAAVAHGNGKWVLATGNSDYYWQPAEILTSDDLINWVSVITNAVAMPGVCYGGGKFVAARVDGAFLLSSDGSNWSNPWPDLGSVPLTDLAHLNGQFVGLNYQKLIFSSNGIDWASAPAPTNTGNLFSITYGKGLYVAGGDYRMVWTSTNALDWTNPDTNLSIYPYSGEVHVAYGNGVFVGAAGYQGDILTSDDGLNWTVQQLVTNEYDSVYFRDVTFGNGRFVAVSETTLATSVDGTNWFTTRTNLYLSRVVGGAGKFVAVGDNTIATSADGTNWTAQTSIDFGLLSDVAYGAGWFVATTTAYYSNPALIKQPRPIWISNDGIHWAKRYPGTTQGLGPIEFGNGTFVMGTQNGGLLQSEPLVTLRLIMQSSPCLQLSGPHDRSYRIEYLDAPGQTNDWSVFATITTTNVPTQVCDPTWTNSLTRLYRAVLLP